ncbi:hypothetical protein CYLTODRAFT_440727 [Cylindrobasidium torrendii FP15055 ss-10]|uniref:Zn(2)-C6 fungal-type domain-containing protein n=1 Tax=Cylindrobasidium torrendii FP15055 ss-10 TaxID=1314674 RepID=A0A0D7BP46_9AGAR|nr:hypothetical protein CYLTODRAFT_440727 [Cylindrobasidium torrendii FP15055 ss-10]
MAKDQASSAEPRPRKKPGRVPTSCAECRRLKLRCDKGVPCEKCVTRGCASICPDGALTTGRGNRLVLANTEQLHARIDQLCSRIRELEDALRALQTTVSANSHELLREDLLQIKSPESSLFTTLTQKTAQPASTSPAATSSSSSGGSSTTTHPSPASSQSSTADESFVDAFGTLTIGYNGEANFYGKTARSEYLIRALSKPQTDSRLLPRLSRRLMDSYSCDSDLHDENVGREAFSMLPPLSEAMRLCDLYLDHGRYLYYPIERNELLDEILTPIYRCECFESIQPTCYHKLALLFSIFALAMLFDPNMPPYCDQAAEYSYLAKAAFGPFATVNKSTTLYGIQAMIHMTQYSELSDWEAVGSNTAWTYTGAAVRVGLSIGLQLDPARWNLCEDLTQRRCRTFWQLFTADLWQSFEFGRPPMISPQYVDCPMPKEASLTAEESSREAGFHSWVWRYTTLVHTVMATAFGSKNPPYNTILELDRKIRDFPVPERLQLCVPTSDKIAPIHYMQRWSVVLYKDTVLLHLHRAYFAQALQDQPDNLANHRYLPSVMATYRSAWRMIQGLTMVREKAPQLSTRVSMCWSHALAGAITMCLLVTRAPTSKMARPSLQELDTVAKTFEDAAETCKPAANILSTIQTLRRKAHEAMDPLMAQTTAEDISGAELDRLGGKTHLMVSPELTSSQAHSEEARPVPSPTPQSMLPPSSYIHPTLTADMEMLLSVPQVEEEPNRTLEDVLSGRQHPNLLNLPESLHWMPRVMFDPQSSFVDPMAMNVDFNNVFGMSGTESMVPQDVLGHGVSPMSGPMNGGGSGGGGVPQAHGNANANGAEGGQFSPILDSTWQSLVEQLGF